MIISAAFIVVPVLAAVVLRSSGTLMFLSVCLGSVLATHVAGDASSIISSATPDDGASAMQWAQLGLLVLPFVLTLLFTRKRASSSEMITGVFAAAAAGALLGLLAVPYMTETMSSTFTGSEVWHQIDNLQTSIVIAGSVLVLASFFMGRHKSHDEKKHK